MPKTLSATEIESFRARLIEVAERLFAAHGPDGVTMRQLADALGVSSMTPYRYFEDKDAILAAVRTQAFNRFAAAMEEAGREATKPRAKSGALPRFGGNAYLDFALANPAAYRMMFDVDQPTFEAFPELVAAMERARLTMTQGLRRLSAQKKFDGDVELAAHALWSALHGPIMLELAGLLSPMLDARTLVQTNLDALARHFGLPQSGKPAPRPVRKRKLR
jgi:AcrR family transcriptional regulator